MIDSIINKKRSSHITVDGSARSQTQLINTINTTICLCSANLTIFGDISIVQPENFSSLLSNCEEAISLKELISSATSLCQRYSKIQDEESERLWFSLLDKFVQLQSQMKQFDLENLRENDEKVVDLKALLDTSHMSRGEKYYATQRINGNIKHNFRQSETSRRSVCFSF